MFKTENGGAQIDSLFLESGEFKIQLNGDCSIMLTFMYLNSKKDVKLGSCRVPESALSTEAIEAFDKFTKLAERDFGKILFEGGGTEQPAESTIQDVGLPKGLGEL